MLPIIYSLRTAAAFMILLSSSIVRLPYARAFGSQAAVTFISRGALFSPSTRIAKIYKRDCRANNAIRFTQRSHKQSSLAMSSSGSVELLCVHVFVSVKPGTEAAFLEASLANARASAKEPGVSRFDVVQQIDDSTKFVLVEVYNNDSAPAAHKETAHYLKWRETVADMMAEPRSAIKYKNLFPTTDAGWDYGDAALE
uniref:ABM domain-containing protein n=2 Tax=Corethron hystrix TaxID=216773 RepID=A0A6U5H612_9STRA|mmetsp:Transcript_29298/g.67276  ORF Transcript_29298/g.67276 Transcript_29298/m.67276 type:complete len:198 (+) Transcript_29298:171-764(+)